MRALLVAAIATLALLTGGPAYAGVEGDYNMNGIPDTQDDFGAIVDAQEKDFEKDVRDGYTEIGAPVGDPPLTVDVPCAEQTTLTPDCQKWVDDQVELSICDLNGGTWNVAELRCEYPPPPVHIFKRNYT